MDATEPHAPSALPLKPDIGWEGFAAVDMRVGTVVAVGGFPEARKPAWKVTVDFGPLLGRRITSAQVTNYAADDLIGRRVVGAMNLGTRRIAGLDSQFLLLGALEPDGTVRLLTVDHDVPDGAPVA